MQNVVITGSTRGLGFALAETFLKHGCNVTISGKNTTHIKTAEEKLSAYPDHLMSTPCDVRRRPDLQRLWDSSIEKWGSIDIWINNAGINQPNQSLWELSAEDANNILNTNLVGAMYGSQIAMQGMLTQGYGYIYNMEGFGSNEMQSRGLNFYGTTKRALTYYTTAFAKEAAGSGVNVCLLSPGMMVTDFILNGPGASHDQQSAKKIFNILGDKPETVAKFLAGKMLQNPSNGSRIAWLTKRKAYGRFLKAVFVKRDLFTDIEQ